MFHLFIDYLSRLDVRSPEVFIYLGWFFLALFVLGLIPHPMLDKKQKQFCDRIKHFFLFCPSDLSRKTKCELTEVSLSRFASFQTVDKT